MATAFDKWKSKAVEEAKKEGVSIEKIQLEICNFMQKQYPEIKWEIIHCGFIENDKLLKRPSFFLYDKKMKYKSVRSYKKQKQIEQDSNIIWIRLAKSESEDKSEKRYIGVVGRGYDWDKNWKTQTTAGKLVAHANLIYDKSHIFLIRIDNLDGKIIGDFEKEIGNYLREKIPTIDYDSHNR